MRSVLLTKEAGTACFKNSCDTPFENRWSKLFVITFTRLQGSWVGWCLHSQSACSPHCTPRWLGWAGGCNWAHGSALWATSLSSFRSQFTCSPSLTAQSKTAGPPPSLFTPLPTLFLFSALITSDTRYVPVCYRLSPPVGNYTPWQRDLLGFIHCVFSGPTV